VRIDISVERRKRADPLEGPPAAVGSVEEHVLIALGESDRESPATKVAGPPINRS
jgi:hypothetical protein